MLRAERQPARLPAATLAEIAHLIETRFGTHTLIPFIDDIRSGRYALDCGENDAGLVLALVRRYADLPLGLVDGYVAFCAVRSGRRVLTLDRRHFDVVGRELGLEVLP